MLKGRLIRIALLSIATVGIAAFIVKYKDDNSQPCNNGFDYSPESDWVDHIQQ